MKIDIRYNNAMYDMWMKKPKHVRAYLNARWRARDRIEARAFFAIIDALINKFRKWKIKKFMKGFNRINALANLGNKRKKHVVEEVQEPEEESELYDGGFKDLKEEAPNYFNHLIRSNIYTKRRNGV